jgi:hypothetical protein
MSLSEFSRTNPYAYFRRITKMRIWGLIFLTGNIMPLVLLKAIYTQ